MQKKNYSISIIIPVLNEIKSLDKTIKIISKIQINKEILIITSKKHANKKTIDYLKNLSKSNKAIKFHYQEKPFVGGAIMTGIKKSKKFFVAIMAADLETNPHHLKRLISKSIRNQNSIICGDRWIKKNSFKNYGFVNKILNLFAQKIIKFFININIYDFTFAYRIYPKNALKGFDLKELRNGWSLELLINPYKKGFNFLPVSTNWVARNEGEKSNVIINYLSFFKILIYYVFNYDFYSNNNN